MFNINTHLAFRHIPYMSVRCDNIIGCTQEFLIVFAFAGDSTITRFFAISHSSNTFLVFKNKQTIHYFRWRCKVKFFSIPFLIHLLPHFSPTSSIHFMQSCPIISRSLAHSSGNSFLLTALSCHRIFTVSNIGEFSDNSNIPPNHSLHICLSLGIFCIFR